MMDGNLCPASSSDLRASPVAYASKTPNIADPLTVDALWPDEPDSRAPRHTPRRRGREDFARIDLACQLYQRYLKEGASSPGQHTSDAIAQTRTSRAPSISRKGGPQGKLNGQNG